MVPSEPNISDISEPIDGFIGFCGTTIITNTAKYQICFEQAKDCAPYNIQYHLLRYHTLTYRIKQMIKMYNPM